MPKFTLTDDVQLHYRVDDFTDPWSEAETVLMLHGNAESGAVWYGWVPTLARHYRLVRPDMRGFGQSTPMPRDFPWNIDVLADDYIALMDALGVDTFHLVGAKLGSTAARRVAARFPDRIKTLTLVGAPRPDRSAVAANVPGWTAEFEQENGVASWAERTMRSRLGSDFPNEGVDWWINLMGKTAQSTQIGFMQHIPATDIGDDMAKITAPTLVITTEGSALGTVEETRAWQENIPQSRLLVLPGDSYHVAASDAARCAEEALAFMTGGHEAL